MEKESLKTSLKKNCNYFDQSICPEHVYISWSLDPDLKVFFPDRFFEFSTKGCLWQCLQCYLTKSSNGIFCDLAQKYPWNLRFAQKISKISGQESTFVNAQYWPVAIWLRDCEMDNGSSFCLPAHLRTKYYTILQYCWHHTALHGSSPPNVSLVTNIEASGRECGGMCSQDLHHFFLRDITNTINQHSTAGYCLVYQSCKTFFLCPCYKRTLLQNRYWECLEGTCKGAAEVITIRGRAHIT